MRVLTISGFAPIWKRYPVDVLDLEEGITVGGGEEGFLRTAAGLAELGHEVVAYHCGEAGRWRGVEFRTLEAPLYPEVVKDGWDAICGWSTIKPLEFARPGVRRLFFQQLNDLNLPHDWRKVDAIISPSADHAKMVRAWGWEGKQGVVHNGLDFDLYADAPAWESRPMWVGYWSSPDRGLHHLLRAWPTVRRVIPEARLHVFYEIKRYLDMVSSMPIGFYGGRGMEMAHLIPHALADETVVVHGAVTRKALARIQKQCRVHCYPYDPFAYCEGFAGAVNQGLTAGCTVMATPKDALPSLYGDSIWWIEKDLLDRDFTSWLADRVIEGLRGTLQGGEAARAAARARRGRFTWANAAREMEAVCRGEWS